jgi:hypothetical protein
MSCLNEIEVQAVVDGEASDASQAHAAQCAGCRDRVEARRGDMMALSALMSAGSETAPDVHARMRDAIAAGGHARGATTLRAQPRQSWHRPGWVSAAATAAAIAIVVFLILPRFGAPTTLSAAEILGRSLQTLSGTTGVETLEYDLFITGEMPAPHRIEQLIDHDQPGRYRFSNYGPDGVLESSIGQDGHGGRRFVLIRVDGRNYIINMASAGEVRLSLPEMRQALVETAITMMQATSDPHLLIEDTPTGRNYVVEVPPVTPTSGAAPFDLYQARAVIDEGDFTIRELEARGSLLKQPFSVSFKLLRRSVRPSSEVAAHEFEIAAGPTDVVLEGDSTNNPVADVVTTLLREIGRAKGN